jgi:hypothetical protein
MNRRGLFVMVLLAGLLAAPAMAQSGGTSKKSAGGPDFGWKGWGVRAGVSSNPDQIYGGVHFDLGTFAKNVRWRPSVELGFGDDATLLQINFGEVHYIFSQVQVWKPYVGGSVGFNYVKVDGLPSGVDDTDTNIGLMGVGGVETKLKSGVGFLLEARVGLTNDDPDFKVGCGWSWK